MTDSPSFLLGADQAAPTSSPSRVRPAPSGCRLAHQEPHHFPGRHSGVMPSGPQHPAPAPKNLSGADAEDLALYREKFRRRLPE